MSDENETHLRTNRNTLSDLKYQRPKYIYLEASTYNSPHTSSDFISSAKCQPLVPAPQPQDHKVDFTGVGVAFWVKIRLLLFSEGESKGKELTDEAVKNATRLGNNNNIAELFYKGGKRERIGN